MTWLYLLTGCILLVFLNWLNEKTGWCRVDTPLEHYHVFLLFVLLDTWFKGVWWTGLPFLIAETMQDHPFAIGKKYFWASTLISVAILLVKILFILF